MRRLNFSVNLLCVIFSIFFASCGLETVMNISAPTQIVQEPLYSGSDFANWYCDFYTAETQNANLEGGRFLGTEIYYKIYNNSSSLESQRSAILSVNTAANNTAAAKKMIESYTYQTLGTSITTQNTVFIPDSQSTRRVTFRLKSYNGTKSTSSEIYRLEACVLFNMLNMGYIPYRNGNSKSFDFFDDDEDNKGGTRDVEPVEGDADYYYSSSQSETDTYYVQLFAVGVAFDANTLANSYSLVLNLGSIPIRKHQ